MASREEGAPRATAELPVPVCEGTYELRLTLPLPVQDSGAAADEGTTTHPDAPLLVHRTAD